LKANTSDIVSLQSRRGNGLKAPAAKYGLQVVTDTTTGMKKRLTLLTVRSSCYNGNLLEKVLQETSLGGTYSSKQDERRKL